VGKFNLSRLPRAYLQNTGANDNHRLGWVWVLAIRSQALDQDADARSLNGFAVDQGFAKWEGNVPAERVDWSDDGVRVLRENECGMEWNFSDHVGNFKRMKGTQLWRQVRVCKLFCNKGFYPEMHQGVRSTPRIEGAISSEV